MCPRTVSPFHIYIFSAINKVVMEHLNQDRSGRGTMYPVRICGLVLFYGDIDGVINSPRNLVNTQKTSLDMLGHLETKA